jgi:hypothetical protein
MKRITLAGLCILGLASGPAFSQDCPAGTTRQTGGTPANPTAGGNFTDFISGNTICAARGGERWQEQHRGSSQLWDYKLGSSSTVDPTKQVGSWSATNGSNATVTHTYGGTSYVWAVCRVGTAAPFTYTLVSTTGGTITGATILTGQVGCP